VQTPARAIQAQTLGASPRDIRLSNVSRMRTRLRNDMVACLPKLARPRRKRSIRRRTAAISGRAAKPVILRIGSPRFNRLHNHPFGGGNLARGSVT